MRSHGLPPGPRIPPSLQVARWIINPLSLLKECEERFGSTFTLHLPGNYVTVLFSEPSLTREILTGDPDLFLGGKASAPLEPFVGANSIFLLEGEKHRRFRSLMMPPFHGERLQAQGRVMLQTMRDAIQRWPLRTQFSLHKEVHQIAFDVIMRALFAGMAPPAFARLCEVTLEILGMAANPLWFIEKLRVDLGRYSPWGRFLRLQREANQIMHAEFAARSAGRKPLGDDIFGMLMESRTDEGAALSYEELRDEVISLLLAGHETTAASLAWAVVRILEDPHVERRLTEELGDQFGGSPVVVEKLRHLDYLDRVTKETQRHSPVFPIVGRVLGRDAVVGGWRLPAGVMVAACIYLVQRRPDLWPEPDAFRPERFQSPVESSAFIPFGGGVRRCLGATFALYQMKMFLAELFATRRLRLPSGYRPRVVRRAVTLVPSGGTPVIVERAVAQPVAARAAG